MEDCTSQEIRIRNLHFDAIDYGGQVRLTEQLKVCLNTGEDWKKNQCAVLAYAAGIEWIYQGRPNRHPGRKRVEFVATQLREQEFRRAETASQEITGWSYSGGRREVESIAHEPLSYAHERDLRTLNLFLLQEETKIRIRVLELTKDGLAVAHTYPGRTDESEIVYLIASEGRLRWAKPSPLTRTGIWAQRGNEMDEVINHPLVNVKTERESIAETSNHHVIYPCKHCNMKVKTPLTTFSTGVMKDSKGMDTIREEENNSVGMIVTPETQQPETSRGAHRSGLPLAPPSPWRSYQTDLMPRGG